MIELIPCKYRVDGRDGLDEIHISERRRPDGSPRWSIDSNTGVLNKKGIWEYEPSPSNRTEAFFKRCRFASLEKAKTFLLKSYKTLPKT